MCAAKRHVRFTPNSDIDCVFQHVCLGQKRTHAVQQTTIIIRSTHRREWPCFGLGPLVPKKRAPPKRGRQSLWMRLCSDQLANPPASISVANSTAGRRYHERRGYHHAWRYHSAAVVRAAVVTIATAAAIRSSMKAKAASASDLNDQTVLNLIARKRHGLSGN